MDRSRLASAVVLGLCACGGDAWGPVSGAPSMTVATDVWAFSATDVWVLDGGSTVYRYDGAEWSTMETPSTGGLGCIFALSPSDVWLCAGSEVLHYDGAAFAALDVTTPTGLDGLTGVWASSPSDVFAVGDDAIVAHYDGSAWTRTLIDSNFNSSIWGASPTDVYMLGTFDLVHFDGSTWSPIELDGGAGDGQVWGTGADDVWVMTDSSQLGHFDGAAWETVETEDFVGDLAAVWGPAPDDLWAAGSAGAIAHYDGESWDEVEHQEIGAPYLRLFLAVHGSSASDVWAVGQQLGEGGSTALIYRHQP
jgi:hypothetical protein